MVWIPKVRQLMEHNILDAVTRLFDQFKVEIYK